MAIPSLYTTLPMAAGLSQASELIKLPDEKLVWYPNGPRSYSQLQFGDNWEKILRLLETYKKLDEKPSPDKKRILAKLSLVADEVNTFMALNGFSEVLVDDLCDPSAFYMGGIYREGGYHREMGRTGYEILNQYKGFRMKAGAGVKLYEYRQRLILELPNEDGFSIFITREDHPMHKFNQTLLWEEILRGMFFVQSVNAIVPQWRFQKIVIDVADLAGLHTTDDERKTDYYVAQMVMQADCTLGWDGAFFRSGMAASMIEECVQETIDPDIDDFVVEWPVTFCFAREKTFWPSASGYVPEYLFSRADVMMR